MAAEEPRGISEFAEAYEANELKPTQVFATWRRNVTK